MCKNPTCIKESCEIPYGYCHCGCGGKTTIALYTHACNNRIKGEPLRYIKGHYSRLSPVDYIVNEKQDVGSGN